MKKLIHELLEDLAFSAIPKSESRSSFFKQFDELMRDQTIKGIKEASKSLNPILKEKIDSRIMQKDGWRAFAKPTCNNYMLSYNYMLSTLHNGGDKVFKLDGDLAEALYNTDIEIDSTDIHPIFNSFVIYVDGQCLKHIGEYSPPGNFNQKEIQEYYISYIMVEFLDSPYTETGKIMRMVFGYYDPGTNPEDIKNWNNSSFLELDIEGNGIFRPKDGEKNGLGHFFPEQSLFSESDKEKAKRYNEAIINFIFSFMLYVTNKEDDVALVRAAKAPVIITRNAKKARRQLQQTKDESKYNVYYVGQKYSGVFKESKRQFLGHQLDHKAIVRGHWRNQWYGHKPLQEDGTRLAGEYQKQIWIEPFFKGVELEGGGKTTIYKVG